MTLTNTEHQIATWLARGKSPAVIRAELAVSEGTLRVHLSHIRGKTNTPTFDPVALQKWLTQSGKVKTPFHITPAQHRVLQMVAQGHAHKQIAASLHLSPGTVMNHASQACKRLGITAQGYARLKAIQGALMVNGQHKKGVDLMDDPMF